MAVRVQGQITGKNKEQKIHHKAHKEHKEQSVLKGVQLALSVEISKNGDDENDDGGRVGRCAADLLLMRGRRLLRRALV